MALFIIMVSLVVIGVSWTWVNGIDYMHTHHPDYRGEDLFDEEPPKNKKESKEQWDDNKIHSEGNFD